MPELGPMPTRTRLLRSAVLLSLAAAMIAATMSLAAAHAATAATPPRMEQLRFMWAMAQQESGGDHFARNASSGAFGKYQIMPANWPAWAEKYLGDARADQTPHNQERVAFAKIRELHGWLGDWQRVAYWWLTGKSDRNPKRWSRYARRYVANIMRLRQRAPKRGYRLPPRTSSLPSRGDWRLSASRQRLHLKAGGQVWPQRGTLRDGQLVRIHGTATTAGGARWIRVVTMDGRLGWVKHLKTVPARRPRAASRWSDIKDRGAAPMRKDRALVRPRPH